MNIKPNRRAGVVWVICLAIAGVIVIGGLGVYIIIKCCDKLPPLPGKDGGCTNTNDQVSIHLTSVPKSGAGALRVALWQWDGKSKFTLQLLMPENLLNTQPKSYWITGTVDAATGNAKEMQAYDEQGQLVSTNWTPAVIP